MAQIAVEFEYKVTGTVFVEAEDAGFAQQVVQTCEKMADVEQIGYKIQLDTPEVIVLNAYDINE